MNKIIDATSYLLGKKKKSNKSVLRSFRTKTYETILTWLALRSAHRNITER